MYSQVSRDLKGSASRDAFKHWHKQRYEFSSCYALDSDLFLVEGGSNPKILALLEYKRLAESLYDSLTFSEVIAYNHLTTLGIPVFVVQSDEIFNVFSLYKYIKGDPKTHPPAIIVETIFKYGTAYDYWKWELGIRGSKSKEVLDWLRSLFHS